MRLKKIFTNLMLILVILLTSLQVSAGSGFKEKDGLFTKNLEEVFENTNSGSLATKHTYPFGDADIQINQVGFDLLYGVSKDIVRYVGEIPYSNTHDSDGNAFSGMRNLPYQKNNPSIDNEDYWGKTGLENKEQTINSLEAVNGEKVVSLRLFALANVGGIPFGWVYSILSLFTRITTSVMGIIIQLKNINISVIMDALKLDKVNELLVKLFVVSDGADGTLRLAPAMMFALVALVISIIATAFNFIFGHTKTKDIFSDVFVVAIIGFIIVGTALLGKPTEIGTSLSTFVNKVLISANPTMQDGTIFYTSITGGDTNRTNATIEMSSVNKAYIDSQICTQFGVDDISELSFKSLGDENGIIATKYLEGYSESDQTTVDKNLGYYFWFANSSAKKLSKNELPTISETQDSKLSSMVTYLQVLYNNGNDEVKSNITNIMLSLARPSIGFGIVKMLLLMATFGLMAYCLAKYAFKVAIAKMSILLGVLAMPIAGILILTTNKKAVSIGKGLLGIFLVATIKVTILSLFFDLIIFVVSLMVTGNIIFLVIAIVFLSIMMKFNPLIERSIDDILRGYERQFSPESAKLKSDAKIWARQKLHSVKEDAAKGKKVVVGYEEDGTPIFATKSNGVVSTLAGIGENMLQENPINTKSTFDIIADGFKKIGANKTSVNSALRTSDASAYVDKIRAVETDIATQAVAETNGAFNMETGVADYSLMNDTEIALHKKYLNAQKLEDSIQRSFTYYNDRVGGLSVEEENERQRLSKELSDKKSETQKAKTTLQDSMIENRKLKAQEERYDELKENYTGLLKSVDTKDRTQVKDRMLLDKKLWALENKRVASSQELTEADNMAVVKQMNSIEYHNNRTKSGKLVDKVRTKGEVVQKTSEEMYNDLIAGAKETWKKENGLDKDSKPVFSIKGLDSVQEEPTTQSGKMDAVRDMFQQPIDIDDDDE